MTDFYGSDLKSLYLIGVSLIYSLYTIENLIVHDEWVNC